jgi:selenide, water dikinase
MACAMNTPNRDKRRVVMQRSIALGHCVCDPRLTCPCEEFRVRDICHCAGERPRPDGQTVVRLTEHVRSPGCASKIDKGTLQKVLSGLPEVDDPRVLVGASSGDDAGVMLLGGDAQTATILTVDVFAPVVDDSYTFGQIAAANSLSDIYAMGGVPQVALSIIGFPVDVLPAEAMRDILRGGADKMKEAGVPVIGGHSINDAEPKCGFAVVGSCRNGRFVRNAGAQVGDLLVLTKPLGSGIMAFARQIGHIEPTAMEPVARSMATLNRAAGELMVTHGVHAATDVTGFGLLGHLAEIVRHSGRAGVAVELEFAALPLFEGVLALAENQVLPGACERNREALAEGVLDGGGWSADRIGILCGPETSGGILAFLPPNSAGAFVQALHDRGIDAPRVIGRVVGEHAGGQIRAAFAHIAPGLPGDPPPNVPGAPVQSPISRHNVHANPTEKSEMSEKTPATSDCCCASDPAVSTGAANGLPAAANADALKAYLAAVNAPGALSVKHKKLISLALSIVSKCGPCVKLNAQAAADSGATEAEMAEAAALGIAFGGSSAMMFYNTLRGS